MAPPPAKKKVEGAVNVERRTWEPAKYEARAKDRQEFGDDYVDPKTEEQIRDRPEFRPAEQGALGPAGSKRSFLKSREATLGLDSHAGKSRVLTEPDGKMKGTGWYCDVCDCLLRDSSSYLDHINGIKHQRKLGYSMRVERVGVDAVRERFAASSQKRKAEEPNLDPVQDWERRLQRNADQELLDKQQRRDAKKQKEEEVVEEAEEDDEAAAMNAMMGFGSFSAKKR